jgi:hypothetical protein
MATATARCGAETFDGIERRQCTRPASADRSGLPVCRQHARLERVTAWNGLGGTPDPTTTQPTEAAIIERFTELSRAALYITAWEMLRGDRRAKNYTHHILRQYDRDEPALTAFNTYIGEITRSATSALLDLGTLSDSEILARLRAAAA